MTGGRRCLRESTKTIQGELTFVSASGQDETIGATNKSSQETVYWNFSESSHQNGETRNLEAPKFPYIAQTACVLRMMNLLASESSSMDATLYIATDNRHSLSSS